MKPVFVGLHVMYLCDVLMIRVCVYKVKPVYVGLHVMYLCGVLMICACVYKVKPACLLHC